MLREIPTSSWDSENLPLTFLSRHPIFPNCFESRIKHIFTMCNSWPKFFASHFLTLEGSRMTSLAQGKPFNCLSGSWLVFIFFSFSGVKRKEGKERERDEKEKGTGKRRNYNL